MFVLLILAQAFAHEFSDKVPHLTQEEFDQIDQQNVFIMFYAPWCGHCQKLIPDWNQLAEKYRVYAVNCEEQSDLRYRFGVKGFPSLFYLTNGKAHKFNLQRNLENLILFIEGGYEQVDGISIPSSISKWNMFLEEFNNPMVLAAIGVMLFFVLLLILMCVLDGREKSKQEKLRRID